MKSILFAAAIALAPTLAVAEMPATPAQGTQATAEAVIPSAMFLTRQSNYAVFIKDGVPLEIHRQAMRLLWATNPGLGQPLAGDLLALSYPTEPAYTTLAALQ